MQPVSKSWKDKLLDAVDDAIGSVLLSPVAPVLKMCGLGGAVKSVGEFGRGFVTGVAKGLVGTLEGLYNMVVHPLDTLSGMATMAGVAVVGYGNTIPGISPEQRLQKFDDFFGTNLAEVNEGIKQSLSETVDKFADGTSAERGEVVGQAVEFVAEFFVGTKGAGAAMKAVKGGSMGGKAAKVAGVADKVADIVKAAGGKVKQWTLGKLQKSIKGIFGKKKFDMSDYKQSQNEKLGDFGEKVAKDYYRSKGYDEFFEVQNSSGNGVDIVARNSKNGDIIKVEVKTTKQEKLWNNGDTKEIPMSKDQKSMQGDKYTNDRLNRAANEDDGYTDGKSSKQAEAALEAQTQAKKNGAEIKTEKMDIYVDENGKLRTDPVIRNW